MITVFTGKRHSGKSARAEEYAADFAGSKYYVATMRVRSEEDEARVKMHRARREGMDFVTIEQDVAIVKAIDKIKWMENLLGGGDSGRIALIEDLPTLCANEMFLENFEYVPHKDVENTILFGIAFLKEFFDDIVIVTEDNPSVSDYNHEVAGDIPEAEFAAAMEEINAAVRKFADNVIEI